MIAPPQVQAQSFAKAILTDITASLFLAVLVDERAGADPSRVRHYRADANDPFIRKRIYHLVPVKRGFSGLFAAFRPIAEQLLSRGERRPPRDFRA
jgi:hypothetical protein